MATATTDDREEVLGLTPEALRDQALIRLKKRRDFNAHAFVYVIVKRRGVQREIEHLQRSDRNPEH